MPMLIFKNGNLGKFFRSCIVIILSGLGITVLQLQQLSQQTSPTNPLENLNSQVNAERTSLQLLQQLPTFGFTNLVADWIFLKFVQYFGDKQARRETGYSLSPEYFEVVLDRDPRFLEAYFFFSASTSLYAAMPEETVALMEKKLKLLSPKDPPRAYYIWRYKAVDELLFLNDYKAAQRSFEKAAEWASVYSDEEAKRVKKIFRHTAQKLAEDPTDKSVQINAWTTILGYAKDEGTRQNVIHRIEKLGGKVSINSQGRVQVTLPEE